MKKQILALASLTALSAYAQSSVTLYGSADIGLTWTRTGTGTTLPGGGATIGSSKKTALESGIGPGSRLGFRGREDLGGGLAAIFTAEMGMDYSTGTLQQGGLAFGRQIFVGLTGPNWSVTAGRQYSPLDVAFGTTDAMFGFYWGNVVTSSGHGNFQQLGSAAAAGGSYGSTGRVNNALQGTYTTGPFTGKLMVAAGDEAPSSTPSGRAGRLFNPALVYANGPLMIQGSYLWMKTPLSMLVAGAKPETLEEGVIGATYDFGPVKLAGGYYTYQGPQDRTRINAINTVGAAGASPYAYSFDNSRELYIGGVVPVGAHRFTATVARQRYYYPGGEHGNATIVGALFEYFLSKRSNFYISTGKIFNDARAKAPLNATITGIVPNGFGADPVAFSVGMQHRF